jgi:branched-chain amino acid aminotransferase
LVLLDAVDTLGILAAGQFQTLRSPGEFHTGAANFVLIRSGRFLTRSLDNAILHGVTRDSLPTLARDNGYQTEERVFSVREMLEWARDGEAALSGTAAVLAGVGVLVCGDREYTVRNGDVGPLPRHLRQKLVSIQRGERPDP